MKVTELNKKDKIALVEEAIIKITNLIDTTKYTSNRSIKRSFHGLCNIFMDILTKDLQNKEAQYLKNNRDKFGRIKGKNYYELCFDFLPEFANYKPSNASIFWWERSYKGLKLRLDILNDLLKKLKTNDLLEELKK